MKKQNKYEPNNKEQSARFVEASERIKSDDAKNKFDKACATILKGKKKTKM